MSITKYASFEDAQVLDVKGAPTRQHTASLDKIGDYDNYRTSDGYMYVRIRAISSRVNKNHDGWPSIELAGSPELFEHHHGAGGFTVEANDGNKEFGFATFMGKPIFVDHHNSNPKRSRGAIVDSKFRVLDHKTAAKDDEYWGSQDVDPEHMPPTEVELLLEIDAKQFPIIAKAIKDGDIDGFSMGCDVEHSKCSHCGHIASSPEEYCSHIVMKGAHHDFKTADGKRVSRKSYENCYGIKFFEISAVFDPADETAKTKEVHAAVLKEGEILFPPCKNCGQVAGFEPYRFARGYLQCKHCQHLETAKDLANQFNNMLLEHSTDLAMQPETQHPLGDHMGAIKHGENPLPQSFETTAPHEVDTLRDEQICPVCGSDMEGETCDVCQYVKPPRGFDNPDLEKAKHIDQELEQGNEVHIPNEQTQGVPEGAPQGGQAGGQQGGQEGSYLQQTRKAQPTASVISDMRWQPKVHPKVAGRVNKVEKPVHTTSKPATDEPRETTISDQHKPVTAAMLTAQQLIEAAKRNNPGETMSNRVAADAPAGTAADKRVDVTGTGGVIEPSNDAASRADAQVSVTDHGGTGVEGVEAEKHETLPTAGRDSDDAGFDKEKNIEAIPTKTYPHGDNTDPVTDKPPYWTEENKWSATQRQGYDSKPFPNDDISGGSANRGTQPVDPVGKAQDRVNVLDAVSSPDNNSGPTSQWTGTGGSGVTRQQEPVTREVTKSDGIKAHFINAIRLADTELELGMIPKSQKYERIAELEAQSEAEVAAQIQTLARVKTAGLRQAAAHTAGVRRLPSFSRITAAVDKEEPQAENQEMLDAALFTR